MPFDVVTTAGTKITVLSAKESGGGTPGGDVKWSDIKEKPATFPPTIGNTATTAKAGNYIPAWAEITDKPTIPAAQIQSDWNQTDNTKLDFIKNKPATFPPTIGTTATTAKAGDWKPTWADVQSKPTTFTPPAAAADTVGGVKLAAAVADISDGANTEATVNALLKSLRDAGVLAK